MHPPTGNHSTHRQGSTHLSESGTSYQSCSYGFMDQREVEGYIDELFITRKVLLSQIHEMQVRADELSVNRFGYTTLFSIMTSSVVFTKLLPR